MLVGLRAGAVLAFVLALGMVFCALIGLAQGEVAAASLFTGQAAILLFFAAAVRLAFAGREAAVTRQIGFRVLIALWVAAPIIAAPSFFILGSLDGKLAFFEAASAITTTGATVYTNLEIVPVSLLAWRAMLQWLGGLATLVSIILVMAPSGAGGTPLLRTGGGEMHQMFQNRLRGVMLAYGAVTLACFALLVASRISIFDSFALTLSTVSTGGMMPRNGTLSDYGAPLAEWVIAIFMLVGATSLVWHRLVATGRAGRSMTLLEGYGILGIALALSLAYAMAFLVAAGSGSVLPPLQALREGFVTAASLVSTTGFEARNAGATVLPLGVILVVVLIGGGLFSTAGGLKLYRIILMARHSFKELEHIIYPHSVHTDRLGRFAYDGEGMRAIWSAMVLFLGTWAICSLILAAQGVQAEAALIAALSALTNMGPLYAYGWEPAQIWPEFHQMTGLSTVTLSLVMVAGRLEVIGLVAGFSLLFVKR